ncbi:hypothetical protein V8G54_011939 [Vigna mungo]|uniref:Integrase catalytic domain-containing protein n=1 Tax=Vigna mungo TaxID=3915 RepID=A0AAQ3S2V7_VIGMU
MNLFGLNNCVVKFNGLKYIDWAEQIQIQLGVFDLDIAIIIDEMSSTITETSTSDEKSLYEGWHRCNRLSLNLMRMSMERIVIHDHVIGMANIATRLKSMGMEEGRLKKMKDHSIYLATNEGASFSKAKSEKNNKIDKATESPFVKYLESRGIYAQYTMSSTPQQNGVAERRNHILMNMIRTKQFLKLLMNYGLEGNPIYDILMFRVVQQRQQVNVPIPQNEHINVEPTDNEQVTNEQVIEEPQVALRRSVMQKRPTISNDYVVYSVEHKCDLSLDEDPLFQQAHGFHLAQGGHNDLGQGTTFQWQQTIIDNFSIYLLEGNGWTSRERKSIMNHTNEEQENSKGLDSRRRRTKVAVDGRWQQTTGGGWSATVANDGGQSSGGGRGGGWWQTATPDIFETETRAGSTRSDTKFNIVKTPLCSIYV